MNEPSGTIRVLVVEDDADYRQMLAELLKGAPEMECAVAYGSVEEVLVSNPGVIDVVLLDVNLPGSSGLEGIAPIMKMLPDAEIVMLTVFDDAAIVFDSLKAGAAGYLSKGATPDEIVAAVREVHVGGAPMSSVIARKVIASFRQPSLMGHELPTLTDRENDILAAVARGSLDKEIAMEYSLSITTVKTHLRSIYQKLHVHNRTEATRKYLEGN